MPTPWFHVEPAVTALWIDLFSRTIVGWSMGARCDAKLVVDTLEMAQP